MVAPYGTIIKKLGSLFVVEILLFLFIFNFSKIRKKRDIYFGNDSTIWVVKYTNTFYIKKSIGFFYINA